MTRASNIATDLVGSNQITDYSVVSQNFTLDKHKAILRCVSGLGPPSEDGNTVLGGWYFKGTKIPVGGTCNDHIFEVRGANVKTYPGVINLYLCKTFTTKEEGVYSCTMKNSSMTDQTMRVGVYFSGRSESRDMYPITSLLTIFHLSTQLLQ